MSEVEEHASDIFETAMAAETSDLDKRDGEPAEIVFGPEVNDADKWAIIDLLQPECQVEVMRRGDTNVYAVEFRGAD